MKSRVSRGGSEGENDKVPCTSKFHFSKGKYGNIVLAWHGVLIQKADANFLDICAQARKIFGAKDIDASGLQVENINPEIRTRVGLDSESEGEEDEGSVNGDDENHGDDGKNEGKDDEGSANDGGDENHVNDDTASGRSEDEDDQHSNDGNNDYVDDGNGHNQYEANLNNAGPSRSEYVHSPKYDNRDLDAEENYGHGGKVVVETASGEVDRGGRHGAKASRGGQGGRK
jgi:hypothetical protein